MSQSNFIYGEQLTGVVDGVNTVFTSTYPIDRIEDMILGGADYRGFTFVGSTITLDDAPTIAMGAPYVDYFRSDVTPPSAVGSITLKNVRDDVFRRLGRLTSGYVYQTELADYYINEGIRVINNQRTNPKYKVGSYSFNKAQDMNVTVYSATTIPVGVVNTYTPSTGKLILGYSEIVDYASTDADSFNGLTGLDIVYEAGDYVSVGYLIPQGVKKPSEVLLNGVPLDPVDIREYSIRRGKNCYTIHDGYLFVPYSQDTGDIITVYYVKVNLQVSLDNDLVDIENEFYQVLSLYAVYNILMDREDDRYVIQRQKYDEQLRLYKSYLRQSDGINSVIPSNMFSNF